MATEPVAPAPVSALQAAPTPEGAPVAPAACSRALAWRRPGGATAPSTPGARTSGGAEVLPSERQDVPSASGRATADLMDLDEHCDA